MITRLKQVIKKCLPYFAYQLLAARRDGITRRFCPVCRRRVIRFEILDPAYIAELHHHKVPLPFFTYETLGIVESRCPECGTVDRNRLYALYFRQLFSEWKTTKEFSILDIAPTPPLTRFLKQYPFVKYRSADLFSPLADDRVDVMDMHIYQDQTFDFVLFSHVLEHVSDDRKALREVHRVIKSGGRAIIMVPIDLTRTEIDEDSSVTDEHDRWCRFGQGDHVRLYSKQGFGKRLEEAGFIVRQLDVEHFGEAVFCEIGVHPRSVLYVVERSK